MRLVAAVAALLRRLRAERATVVLLFVLVAVTSGAVAAAPRLFSRVADDGLRYELAQGTAIQRNLEFGATDPLPASPGGDPLSAVAAAGESLRDGLAPPVRSLIDETRYVVDSARFKIDEAPVLPTFVTFREADGIEDLLALADGRWPARVLPPETPDPAAPPAFEIALSTAAAERVGLSVGDSLTAKVDVGDPLLRRRFPTPEVAVRIELVGTFTVTESGAHVWFDDPALGAVTIGGTEDEPVAFATGLIAPAAYADVIALGLPTRDRWRLFVDPDRLDAGQLDALVGALRQLKLRYSTTTPGPGVTVLNTGLLAGVERFLAQRATTETMLSLAALGPLAAAAGALGLFAILVVQRRRPALALARGRGASSGQLLATQFWEGRPITSSAARLGLAVAVALVPARSSDLSSIGALAVALGATVILLLATWPVARRARRDLERDTPPAVRISARRLVFEALVVGLSLSAAWLLRERGLAGAEPQGATATTATFDPFLGASPVLIGVAVALLTIRFYPLPVRALGWVTARRRDLVPVLGLRALGRQSSVGSLPLLVLMLTVAIGTFSAVLLASIEHGQAATALQEVGADFRVVAPLGTAFPDAAAVRSLAGVEAVAAATSADALLSTDGRSLTTVRALAVEPAAYDAVLAGAPGAARLSSLLADTPTGSAGGTTGDPIPAIVSTRLSNLAVGDRFDLVLSGRKLSFQVAARLDGFPGIARSTRFVVTSFASVAAAWEGNPLRPSILFVRGPAALVDGLRGLASARPALQVESRDERLASMREAPLVGAVSSGFAIALLLAAVSAGLAVMAVVVLQAHRRSREAALLRTIGLSGRQVAGLTVVEQGFPLVIALGLGVALGLGLAWLLEPGIDLAAFSSPDAIVDLTVDWRSIGVVAASITAVVVVAIAISSWLARRLDVNRTLRMDTD